MIIGCDPNNIGKENNPGHNLVANCTLRLPARDSDPFSHDMQVVGLMALMDGEHIGPFNLGNPGEFTMLELAEVRGNGNRRVRKGLNDLLVASLLASSISKKGVVAFG
jgi:hypothetical protein